MNMNRRQLFALAGAGALAACAGPGGSAVPAFVAAFQAVGAEVGAVVPMLQAAGVKVPAQVLTYVQDILTVANGVGAASTQAQGASALSQIVTYAEDLAPIILPLLGAAVPGVGPALGLVVASLPAIAALLNVSIAAFSPVLQQLANQAPRPASVRAAATFGASPGAFTITSADYLAELIARHS